MLSLLAVLVVALALTVGVRTLTASPKVVSALSSQHAVNVIIQLDPLHLTDLANDTDDWQTKRALVYASLQAHSHTSQKDLRHELDGKNAEYSSFWIDNSLFVPNMTMPLYQFVLGSASHGRIMLDENVGKMQVIRQPRIRLARHKANDHLEQINVHRAWTKYTNGSDDITVASIDTGVQFDHEELALSYKGFKRGHLKRSVLMSSHGSSTVKDVLAQVEPNHRYAWFDAIPSRHKSPYPRDDHGHGTHTMGSIVGSTHGVAPGITWMTARACSEEGCLRSQLTAAAQWVMCPEGQCSEGARIVSNSWGATDPMSMHWFERISKVWREAGITAVFAAGNSGPECDSIFAPATLPDVLTVGAVGPLNKVCSFSSRSSGSSTHGKPDLVAPGLNILSSYPNNKYAEMSGTSMACPLVAGIAALILSQNPKLTPDEVTRAMLKGSRKSEFGDECCSQGSGGCAYGKGLIDAERVLSLV